VLAKPVTHAPPLASMAMPVPPVSVWATEATGEDGVARRVQLGDENISIVAALLPSCNNREIRRPGRTRDPGIAHLVDGDSWCLDWPLVAVTAASAQDPGPHEVARRIVFGDKRVRSPSLKARRGREVRGIGQPSDPRVAARVQPPRSTLVDGCPPEGHCVRGGGRKDR